jgi:hypothetical protein
MKQFLDIVFELPSYKFGSGGISSTIELINAIYREYPHLNIGLHLNEEKQKTNKDLFCFDITTTTGDIKNAPPTDWFIMYSDSPNGNRVIKSEKIKRCAVLMLAYGMAPEREKLNVLNKKIKVFTSTKKIKTLIEEDGVSAIDIGFGVDAAPFYKEEKTRKTLRLAALLKHGSQNKRYAFGIDVCEELLLQGFIDGIITFGSSIHKEVTAKKEFGGFSVDHYDVDKNRLREIFNMSSVFIMPSLSEGLSRTPIEATLCGCPSVLCDGALNEIYFPEQNCKWVEDKDSEMDFVEAAIDILSNDCSDSFRLDMQQRVQPYTWKKTAKNLIGELYGI